MRLATLNTWESADDGTLDFHLTDRTHDFACTVWSPKYSPRRFRGIDHILIRCGNSGGPSLAIRNCRRTFDHGPAIASDHYGLAVDLELAELPPNPELVERPGSKVKAGQAVWSDPVNLFIGVVEIPVAVRALPRRHEPEEHGLDLPGSALLTGMLLLVLVPLVNGRVSGWPLWSWVHQPVLPSIDPLAGLMPSLTHTAQSATVLNLAFVLAAWLCAFGLPRTLAAERAEENT